MTTSFFDVTTNLVVDAFLAERENWGGAGNFNNKDKDGKDDNNNKDDKEVNNNDKVNG